MFEAIHGSALRMVKEKRVKYPNPSSILRAAVMLLRHIGFINQANKLNKAVDTCTNERKIVITGRPNGATCLEFTNCILEKI